MIEEITTRRYIADKESQRSNSKNSLGQAHGSMSIAPPVTIPSMIVVKKAIGPYRRRVFQIKLNGTLKEYDKNDCWNI